MGETHFGPTPVVDRLLASTHGFPYPDSPWRCHCRRHCPRTPPPCRIAGRCRPGHLARSGQPASAVVDRQSGDLDDRAPQLQPFAVRAAVSGLVDLVAVPSLRQGSRGGITNTLVLGDPVGLDHPPIAGCLHRLRHATVVAAAKRACDVVQCVHHRPGLHALVAARLRGGLVCL